MYCMIRSSIGVQGRSLGIGITSVRGIKTVEGVAVAGEIDRADSGWTAVYGTSEEEALKRARDLVDLYGERLNMPLHHTRGQARGLRAGAARLAVAQVARAAQVVAVAVAVARGAVAVVPAAVAVVPAALTPKVELASS